VFRKLTGFLNIVKKNKAVIFFKGDGFFC